ncbi:AbrB/MazE/SpoVT family DNA-binding domain-containing protein [Nocardia sp. NBC_01503]|uniref:AbrB/MazE/SpoVT family DNA-binding domain-containing protein n=1 Tax=Nocardia sp. NBC_01503 TaxID=2975997 RepID=UPI002E7B0CAC|nr:AbrB/MazE/SpoVT family DNA-binding domain-containing protein [Nocardia sp. NBC_01503]WTL35321.1 AbrB/MazE/SpoVT family DNA-binding domain-containing protein [Nocardia sp. NBC_01503]
MDAVARMTSKGQLTVPKAIRDALDLSAGDNVLFRVEGQVVVLARTPDLLELAGSVPVPPAVRGKSWEEIREAAWAEQWRAGEP